MKNNSTEDQELDKTLDLFHPNEMDVDTIIKRCGELDYPISKMLTILQSRCTAEKIVQIAKEIDIQGTRYHQLYWASKYASEVEMRGLLKARATSCAEEKPADLIKSLQAMQDKENINRAIKSRFDIDLDDEA